MRCGSQDIRVQHRPDVLDFRGLTLEVDGLAATVCGNCSLSWTTDGQEHDNLNRIKLAYAAKRDAVRDREGLLTGAQIDEVLRSLGLSKGEAAVLFGGGPNAFGKYISGEVLQSFAMDRLMRLTVVFDAHALRILRMGSTAPLKKNAGGFFVAPAIEVTLVHESSTTDARQPVMMQAQTTNRDVVALS